ncbi:MAG: AAA family ATPase [Candidatus Pacebacteria bacterium]|nr:AAA family ATPase [Candidatus Paceibacterota bacterium]
MKNKKNKAPWIVITGLDGTGKTTLVKELAKDYGEGAFTFHLPYSDFVIPSLKISGKGEPFGDVHTDRLIFATDVRLTNQHLKRWREENDIIFSQRGWMDNFIHGKVQGFSYEETLSSLGAGNLEKATAIICLNANPFVAYSRIKDDRDGDKYETLEYIKKQAKETDNFFKAVEKKDPSLHCFHGIPAVTYDTTEITKQETKQKAKLFLDSVLKK